MSNESGSERFISAFITHNSCNPLNDVLVLLYGIDGLHLGILLSNVLLQRLRAPNMSLLIVYIYCLLQRPNEFNSRLIEGILFQQYVIDEYYKVDSKRLQYLSENQSALRAADYASLGEQLADSGSSEYELDAAR